MSRSIILAYRTSFTKEKTKHIMKTNRFSFVTQLLKTGGRGREVVEPTTSEIACSALTYRCCVLSIIHTAPVHSNRTVTRQILLAQLSGQIQQIISSFSSYFLPWIRSDGLFRRFIPFLLRSPWWSSLCLSLTLSVYNYTLAFSIRYSSPIKLC